MEKQESIDKFDFAVRIAFSRQVIVNIKNWASIKIAVLTYPKQEDKLHFEVLLFQHSDFKRFTFKVA